MSTQQPTPSRRGILLRTNTSSVPGIRARWRKPRYGRPALGLDVRYIADGETRFTTLPATLDGMQRALALREQTVGHVIGVNARTALRRMLAVASEGRGRSVRETPGYAEQSWNT